MKIGFVGTGHMGGSLAQAIAQGGHDLYLTNRTASKAQALAARLPHAKACGLAEAIACDYVFVGVKPKDVDVLLADPLWQKAKGVVVSMVAGLALADLQAKLPQKRLIRILPNTPVAVGEGITLVAYSEGLTDETKKAFADLMAPTGIMSEIDEAKLDAASVLTGSAPVYLDYFVDALVQAGVALGLTPEAATEYVLGMCKGTIALARSSDKSPLTLGKEVCSPGGSTIEGVNRLLEGGLYEIVLEAVKATDYKNHHMTD